LLPKWLKGCEICWLRFYGVDKIAVSTYTTADKGRASCPISCVLAVGLDQFLRSLVMDGDSEPV